MIQRALSRVYGAVTACRNVLYEKGFLSTYHSHLPVISVGNITSGGNGKTPLVLLICQHLSAMGYSPVVLSRGYGGTLSGPLQVDTSMHSPGSVGDEPFMLAKLFGTKVVIARRRAKGARYIEERALGDVIVLDDGFQHRALGRALDIITVYAGSASARAAFREGRLLPEGRFRENRSKALQRVDALVFASRSILSLGPEIRQEVGELPQNGPIFYSKLENPFVAHSNDRTERLASPARIGAFCALANPEAFFRSLEELGFELVRQETFPDHYPVSDEEIRESFLNHSALPLVTTLKDWVKLGDEFRDKVYLLHSELAVEPKEQFSELLSSAVSSKELFRLSR